MENVFKEKFKDYSSSKPAVMSQSDVYLDEDGFTNRKAFVDFVDFLDSSDNIRVAFIDVFLVANKQGRSFGTKALKSFYDSIAKNFIIFRMAGTKFNVMLSQNEEEDFQNFMESMKNQKKVWESLFQFNYVIVPKVICGDNLSEILRQGIDSLFAERNKKEEKDKDEFSLEDLLSSLEEKEETPAPEIQEKINNKPKPIPTVEEEKKKEEPVAEPEPQEEITYAKVYEMPEKKERIVVGDKVVDRIKRDCDWRSEILLHETSPEVKDVKLYVFPFMIVDFASHCPFILVKDDLLNYNVQFGKCVNLTLDRMQFSITASITAQGNFQTQCIKMIQENVKVKGECDVEIQNFSGSKEKMHLSFKDKDIFPIKPNVYGNWDFIVKDGNKLILSQNGLWEFEEIKYAVMADEDEFYLTRTYEEEKVII